MSRTQRAYYGMSVVAGVLAILLGWMNVLLQVRGASVLVSVAAITAGALVLIPNTQYYLQVRSDE